MTNTQTQKIMKTTQIKISCKDNWVEVASKLQIKLPDMKRILNLGETVFDDKKYFSIVSKLVSIEKARMILNWLGAEDFE